MRRFDDANLWSGVYRLPYTRTVRGDGFIMKSRGVYPTLVITLRLRYWSLPFSVSVGGHLLSKPGLTFGIGPLYISWSVL